MKILYINVLYEPYIGGGAEITLKHLVEGMQKRGHNVRVLTFSAEKKKIVDIINNVEIIRIPINNLYFPYFKDKYKPSYKKMLLWHLIDIYNFSYFSLLKKEILNFKPDIVSVHNMQGFSVIIWDILKSLDLPFVQVLHDQYLLCPANMFRGNKVCNKQCLKCKIIRYPHKLKSVDVNVVGISRFILNKFLEYGYFKKSFIKEVIYNSRNFNRELLKLDNRNNSSDIVFGFIGTLISYKGIELLLEIFYKNPLFKNYKLLIAGNGEKSYTNYLKSKYNSNNILFLGHVRPERFFPNVDVTIVPSLWEEPLGMIVIESLLFGKPVIVSNYGGLPELINDTRGYVFNPYIKEDLLNKLVKFVENINFFRNNKENIRNSALAEFGYEQWLNKWENIYFRLKGK